ncbi:MAG: hypothetical protein C4B59_16485 [Candidatus Methanogaster sp.]|uniref:Uncharacterized protein n=1 Tax=Candidatus Methanogaster sp. TaxID=3386292 RepID=A0AC61KY68_9EURY|nr:MAG: hypothetical protein C4B59_16485 [ANME-2 cluster archaeon]
MYYKTEYFSDVINALNYGFLNRLLGAVASEPTLGMEIASRQFGGIQLVYNATEALMKDYVDNIKYVTYNGIVVFGFRNRALTYPRLVVHPSYAEHDLEYLLTLAHEAYHIAWIEILGETEKRLYATEKRLYATEKRLYATEKRLYATEKRLYAIQKRLQGELKEIATLYLPDAINYKNAPVELIAEILAHELMADMYATMVAGEAYPKILCEYYLPISLDTMTQKPHPSYSSFAIGSLKIRVAVAALEMMNWEGDHIKEVITSVNKKVRHWESLSWNVASKQLGKDEMETLGLADIKKKLDSVCCAIENKGILSDMSELIEQPYYPKDNDEREVLQRKLEKVKDILMGEPTPADMAEIWKDGVRPRHLISLLAQEKGINRNAVLIAMGYHKNILDRFRQKE